MKRITEEDASSSNHEQESIMQMDESTPSHAKKRKKVYTFLYQGVHFTKETKPILAENAEA